MKGRNSVAVVTGVVISCVIAGAGGVAAASAASRLPAASVSGKAVFSRGVGAVLPTNGKMTVVSVSCPDKSRTVCRGSVALVPRGDTARTLGSRALARVSFRLARGAAADLKLRLSPSARRALSRGPLYVTAVLGAALSRAPVKVIAKRAVALATARTFKALMAPRESAPFDCWENAQCVDFSWNWTIPAGHMLVMQKFTCPAGEPRLHQGSHKNGHGQTDAEIEASASKGTGYSAFTIATVARIEPNDDHTYTSFYNMVGWPKGDLLFNNVWAPVFDDGHFKLVVTCTNAESPYAGGRGAAEGNNGDTDNTSALFFPWTWG